MAPSTPTTTTTRRARSETDAVRHRGKDTDWQHRVFSPALARCHLANHPEQSSLYQRHALELRLQFPERVTVSQTAAKSMFTRGKMLKITRAAKGEVVFTVSGRLGAENLAELKTQFSSEASGRPIVLDLRELTLVDQDAVRFLMQCEADNIQLKNCPAYIREWITREQKPKL